jgi:protoheme IX farnesyltransferase
MLPAKPIPEALVGQDWPGAHAGASAGDYIALLKPRVMSLVVFTAVVGLYLAPVAIHPFLAFVAVLCIAIGAGASGAINMWYDRDIDALMTRTRNRPLPAGRITAENALAFGTILAVFSVALMGLAVNLLAAAFLALTIAFYVFVYTVWLKRRTPQNIVIGGAAGAFPPLVGWTAAAGDVALMPLLLFAIIFLWTPPHFWALALYRDGDYRRAGIPMLPAVAGVEATRRQILIYTVALLLVSLVPALCGLSGPLFAAAAAISGLRFVWLAWRLLRERSDNRAKHVFGYSIVYLFLLFAALLVDKAVIG